MKRTDLTAIARRLALMIGGEAMQSGFHFALNILLVHMLSAQDYGVFAIVMVIGGLSLTYIRSLTAMPASIWIGQSRTKSAADIFEVTFGSGATLLSTLIGLGVAILLHLWLGTGAIAGGCFIGLWSMRSHLRTAFFALGRQKVVSFGDLAFTLSGVGLTGVALWMRGDLLQEVLLVLAAANGLGIVVMLSLARRPVRVSFGRGVWRRYRRLRGQLGWSGVSVTMGNLQAQGMALLVAAIAGPAGYAPIAAVLVLFVPLRVGAAALVNMVQPELSGLLARGEIDKVWRRTKVWSAIMAAGGIIYGAGMIALLPFIKSQAFVGTPIYLLGFLAWAIYTVSMLYVMPRAVLEILSAFRTLAFIAAAAAVVGMGTVGVILHMAPPAWSLAGAAISETIVLVASWLVVRRRLMSMSEGADRQLFGFKRRHLGGTEPYGSPFHS